MTSYFRMYQKKTKSEDNDLFSPLKKLFALLIVNLPYRVETLKRIQNSFIINIYFNNDIKFC